MLHLIQVAIFKQEIKVCNGTAVQDQVLHFRGEYDFLRAIYQSTQGSLSQLL